MINLTLMRDGCKGKSLVGRASEGEFLWDGLCDSKGLFFTAEELLGRS